MLWWFDSALSHQSFYTSGRYRGNIPLSVPITSKSREEVRQMKRQKPKEWRPRGESFRPGHVHRVKTKYTRKLKHKGRRFDEE